MTKRLSLNFVSDVSCPWCVIGLKGLLAALARLEGEVEADIHFQPFELNPQMGPEGEDVDEHIARKYGAGAEQMAQTREMIRTRAAAVGFTMSATGANGTKRRIYNTFDAHRLLHWADIQAPERQLALKLALFEAYFTRGEAPSDPDVLLTAVTQAGLDAAEARAILAGDRYGAEVREAEQLWLSRGIQSVPAVIVNGRYLISGGQPPEAYEDALRKIAEAA
ncbi:DsbA family oxidoreductase [Nitrospirillum pindoramense]|uniref:Putative DsbA family dithiol-disulfide isomerase n=1 Tax=Nitrospirillum amazonense TaxID=28077 RepID=A0A560HGZ1_9PROT|nr:DsbA family oxidoreductase [Nitrospirillum amazonense]TWB45737.1 putative DsbA family dithiol-disulfide isomerase [Nitrospirillum amazonense]